MGVYFYPYPGHAAGLVDMQRAAAVAQAAGVKGSREEFQWARIEPRTFWDNFRNNGDDPFYFEHQMRILDRQFRPKPAYRTYAILTRVLRELGVDRRLELEDQTFAWVFAGKAAADGRRVTVLWNPHRDTEPLVAVRTGRVQRLNAVGEVTWLEARDTGGCECHCIVVRRFTCSTRAPGWKARTTGTGLFAVNERIAFINYHRAPEIGYLPAVNGERPRLFGAGLWNSGF
jgi:hypothetical protein